MELKEKVYLESLGCSKNLIDSEVMLGSLLHGGYAFTTDKNEADIIIVNTCAFINDATQEALETISSLVPLKKKGACRKLVVAGCLPQRYCSNLTKKFTELNDVDLFVGVGDFPKIAELLRTADRDTPLSSPFHLNAPPFLLDHTTPRIRATPPHTAYVKIAEGCSHRCTFCTIPLIKGPYQSRLPESILTEVHTLGEEGVKEINLIAQDTTFYGNDLRTKIDLAHLLKLLSPIEQTNWIRILYCHPDHLTADLISVIGKEAKICNYIDLPLQHSSNTILKKMGREKKYRQIKKLIAQLRESIPDLWIRTTFIVGFPGETNDDFSQLTEFVKEIEFEHLGAFKYSNEEGTQASRFGDTVSPDIIEERYHLLMSAQSSIAFKKNQALIGTMQTVLIESVEKEKGLLSGRTFFQAPDIDGIVFITKGTALIGDMVQVTITGASEYDLFGEITHIPGRDTYR
jgi:ribosomal protein S12 methylthiotransferase